MINEMTLKQNKKISSNIALLVTLTTIVTTIFGTIVIVAYAQTQDSSSTTQSTSKIDKYGSINSTQYDENGVKAWILEGGWTFTDLNSSSASSAFGATMYMTKPDGSAQHTHKISDFKTTENPSTIDNTTTYNGTATISMKDGPVNDVPISIKINDNGKVSIWIDPESVDNHFGTNPIDGTLLTS